MHSLIEAWAEPPAHSTNATHTQLLTELREHPGQWARVGIKQRAATKLARENVDIEARYVATGTPQQAIYMRSVSTR